MTVEELQIIISAKTETAQSKIAKVKEKIAGLQPKKSPDVNVTTEKAQGNLKKLQAEVDRTQTKIDKLNQKMAGVYAKQDAIVGKYTGLPALTGMTKDQTLDYMVGQDPQMQKLNAQLDETDAQIAPLKAHLAETRTQIEAVGSAAEPAAVKTRALGESMRTAGNRIQGAGHSSRYFGQMTRRMLLSMALYKGVSFILQSISDGIQNMALGSSQANSTMSQLASSALYLKNSIAAALMPALQALTPIINQVADALANVFNTISMLTARIFNHSSTVAIAQRANVNYAATLNKTGTSADTAKKKVKELQRTVMGFDELNVLNKPTSSATPKSSSTSDKSPGMPSYKSMFKTVKVPGWIDKIGEKTDQIKRFIQNNIDAIHRMLRLAPLVIGAILVFSGANIPLGLGLMAFGAVEMAKQAKEDWNYLTNKTTSSLAKIKRVLAIAGAVELALGAIFAFSGANVPLGIGLMIGGITTTVATLKWDSLGNNVKNAVNNITIVLGGAELTVGAILAFSGANIPLGIGLMIGGATTLGTATVVNWNSMTTPILNSITSLMSALGGALLAIGAIFTFSGANLPLGIGLMAAGAVTLGTAAVINWKSGKAKVSTVLSDITGAISGALLAVGALLAFTGVNVPLGIGLIAVGAIGLGVAVALNWNGMSTQTRTTVFDIAKIVGGSLLALGAILTLSGAGAPLGIAMMAIGGLSLASAIAIDWEYIPNKVKGALKTIKDFATGWLDAAKKDVFGFVNKVIDAINGLIGGIDWVLGVLGSKTKVKPLQTLKYAYGTGEHPGGPALVNDQAGSLYREMVQLPNGNTFIPQGRNVLIPDLPRGSKVLPAKETNMLFPRYAGGIGNFFGNAVAELKKLNPATIWGYISDPKKLLELVADKFVGKISIGEPWISIGNSSIKFITSNVLKPFSNFLNNFKATTDSGSGVEQWKSIASQALAITGHFSAHNLQLLLAQMKTESNGNPSAINLWDSNAKAGHPSQGLMQVIPSTFSTYALAPYNENILDPLSNIIAAIRYTWSRYGGVDGVWGQGHGYANGIGKFDFSGWYKDGGIFTSPTIAGIGDDGPEAALPLNDSVYSRIAKGIEKNSDGDISDEALELLRSIDHSLKQGHSINVRMDVDGKPFVNKVIKEASNQDKRYHPVASS